MITNDLAPELSVWLKRDPELGNVKALARRIGYGDQSTHVYRILKNSQQHKHLRAPLLLCGVLGILREDGGPNIDEFARQALDSSRGHFKAWLQKQMIKSGVTGIRPLARRMGVNSSQVERIVSGEYQYVQLRIYRDIARGLKVSLYDLLLVLFQGNPDVKLLLPPSESCTFKQSDEREGVTNISNSRFWEIAA